MTIEENIPLAPFTTFGIGGPARFFVRIKSVDELREALAYATQQKLAVFILGGGSNVLISNEGFVGLVIKIEIDSIEWKEQEKEGEEKTPDVLLIAGAGESWDGLVQKAVGKNLWGIENLSGIPGTVGAAPIQNIGAYGAELKDTLAWVEALDMHTGEIKTFGKSECELSYRTSRFKKETGRFVLLRAAFRLSAVPKPALSYRDFAEAFVDTGSPSLSDIRKAVLTIRANKFPDLTKEGTAGSFFLNPIVPHECAERLMQQYPGLPNFAAPGGVKLSLAWLLDKVLNLRGLTVGSARLYEKQPLVIVAQKNSSANDVVALAHYVKEKIKTEIGIDIEEEVRIVQ